jgi:O-antigen/teichoic acid export membrane protein
MSAPRKLSTNTLALVVGNAGSLVLAFALSVLIGRILGEDGLGVYVAVLAWVFPLLMAAEFGTNTLLTRDLAADLSQTPDYLAATGRIRLLFGLLLMVGLVVVAPLLSDDPSVVIGLRIAAPLLLIEPAYGAYTAIFRAHRSMLPIPMLNLGMLVAQLLLSGLVLWDGMGVLTVLLVNTVTSGGRLLAALIIYRCQYPNRQQRNKAIKQQSILAKALPFAFAGVLGALLLRAPYLLLESLSGVAAVGLFAAGMRFIEALRMVPQAFFDALLPQLVAYRRQSHYPQPSRKNSVVPLIAFGLMIGVGATFCAELLIRWTYGEGFEASAWVMIAAGWLLWVALVRQLWTVRAIAAGDEWRVNRVLAVMLLVMIISGWWLVSVRGAVGAVLAWGAAETVGLLLLIPVSTKRPYTPAE